MAKKKRKRYTEEFKREAVRLMLTRGERTVADVAQSVGVPESLLQSWRKRYPDAAEAVRRERGETPEQELKRLRRENAQLKRDKKKQQASSRGRVRDGRVHRGGEAPLHHLVPRNSALFLGSLG